VYFESLSVESVAWSGIDTYKPSAGPATALHATDDGTRFPVEPEPPSVQAPTTKSRIPASATRNIEVDILHNQSFREQKKKKKKKKRCNSLQQSSNATKPTKIKQIAKQIQTSNTTMPKRFTRDSLLLFLARV
jgi:hypothetical protein